MRIDRWLWAARFFKTRSLAARAIDGGRVKVGGERVKASRQLKPGDEVAIHVGPLEWAVQVLAVSARRGPAAQAAMLHRERRAGRGGSRSSRRNAGSRPGAQSQGPADQARPAPDPSVYR